MQIAPRAHGPSGMQRTCTDRFLVVVDEDLSCSQGAQSPGQAVQTHLEAEQQRALKGASPSPCALRTFKNTPAPAAPLVWACARHRALAASLHGTARASTTLREFLRLEVFRVGMGRLEAPSDHPRPSSRAAEELPYEPTCFLRRLGAGVPLLALGWVREAGCGAPAGHAAPLNASRGAAERAQKRARRGERPLRG